MKIYFLPSILLFLLAGCAAPDSDEATTPAPTAGSETDNAAWIQELIEHREEVDEDYRTSRTSPMAGAQYLKSEPVDKVYLMREDRIFDLAYSVDPAAEIVVSKEGEGWVWEDLGGNTVCEVEDERVATGSSLEDPATFTIAGLTLSFYPAEDRVTFIVFDPERPVFKAFEHLLYFPPDKSYAVPAKLAKIAEPDEVEMITNRNLKKTFYRYAKLEFQVGGEDQELTAYKYALTGEGSDSLFIPFKDATTGDETYGAGRFIDVDEPESEHFLLDFNRAYNPLCNYSPAYNCPVPPRENHLRVAIRAGERTYPH